MKNIKSTKAKIPVADAKPAAKVPEAKALEATPERKRSAKVTTSKADAPRTAQPPRQPAPTTTEAAPRRQITSDLIAARAYIIWEKQGRPQGSDLANWLLAESQLKQEIQSFTA
jgi:hypothetical protein